MSIYSATSLYTDFAEYLIKHIFRSLCVKFHQKRPLTMSSQPGCSDDRRGRPSRDERAELGRKDRSRTSARDSGRRDHFEHCQAARSRTSGRDLKQRGNFDPGQVARRRTSGRESDGGREQDLIKNANRNKRVLNNDNNKDERSPFRFNNHDRKRESQVEHINASLRYYPSR